MTLIRCYSCRVLFEKEKPECPDCGAKKRPVNVALSSQAWRSNLNWHADHADKYT
jgi:rRNA maturation endonuclease Nob1